MDSGGIKSDFPSSSFPEYSKAAKPKSESTPLFKSQETTSETSLKPSSIKTIRDSEQYSKKQMQGVVNEIKEWHTVMQSLAQPKEPTSLRQWARNNSEALVNHITDPAQNKKDPLHLTLETVTHGNAVSSIEQPLGKRSAYIFDKTVIESIQEQYENQAATAKKIKTLNKWISSAKAYLVERYTVIRRAAISLPENFALASVMPTAWGITHVAAIGFSWAGMTVAAILDGIYLRRKKANDSLQKKWIKNFESQTPSVEIDTIKAKKTIDAIRQKRKQAFDKAWIDSWPEFDKWFGEILHTNSDLAKIEGLLKEKGVHIDRLMPPIQTKAELEKRLHMKNRETETFLFQQYVEFKDTNRILVRNAAKTLALVKQKFEQFFVKLKLSNAKYQFSLSLFIAIVLITLKALAIASVLAMPQFALPVLAVGLVACGAILLIRSLYHFHKRQPNLFKETLQGAQIKIAFKTIPFLIQSFRLKRKEANYLKIAKLAAYMNPHNYRNAKNISEEKLPIARFMVEENLMNPDVKSHHWQKKVKEFERMEKKMEKEFIKLQKKESQLLKEIESLEEKVNNWHEEIDHLKNDLQQATIKDFARTFHLDSLINSKNPGKPVQISFVEIFVDGLLNDTEFPDNQTRKILKEHMNIDLAKIQENYNKVEMRDELIKNISSFIEMNDRELINLIRKNHA